MTDLCKYKDALGEPRKGFHEARIGDYALWDMVGTVFIMLIIVLLSGSTVAALMVVPATLFLHWLFCVDTALNRQLGLV